MGEKEAERPPVIVETQEVLVTTPVLVDEDRVDWDEIIPRLKAMGTDIVFPGRRGDGTSRRF